MENIVVVDGVHLKNMTYTVERSARISWNLRTFSHSGDHEDVSHGNSENTHGPEEDISGGPP